MNCAKCFPKFASRMISLGVTKCTTGNAELFVCPRCRAKFFIQCNQFVNQQPANEKCSN